MTVEDLYVNSFNNAEHGWSVQGTTPYLQNSDGDFIYTVGSVNAKESAFLFPASAGSGTIASVKIRVENKQVIIDVGAGRGAYVYVWDGSAYQLLGYLYPTESYVWKEFDASAILNSWAKINGAKLRFVSLVEDMLSKVYVRRGVRRVDYSVAAGAVLRRLLVGVGL